MKNDTSIELHLPTPVEKMSFRGRDYFLKRDELISEDFSGNKGRKFHSILKKELPHIKRVISYGSNQSNAMYSLSVLAKARGWEFIYHTDHIPDLLRRTPVGNYAAALRNGTQFITGKKMDEIELDDETLFIEEGGRELFALEGVRELAMEIERWYDEENLDELDIFLPSGTGTTALFLQKSLIEAGSAIRVYTTPCVGDRDYLLEQFRMLEEDRSLYPTIVDSARKYHFGKLYREFYEIWIELRDSCGVEFDLLYDPKGWLVLTQYEREMAKNILYIHQGGIKGNESMLARYERKFARR